MLFNKCDVTVFFHFYSVDACIEIINEYACIQFFSSERSVPTLR